MKTKIILILAIVSQIAFSSAFAILPDPLIISFNDGAKFIGRATNPTVLLSYEQNPDNAVSKDTVVLFNRSELPNYSGIYWMGSNFNNGKIVNIGDDPTNQYKYLVVQAKQSARNSFTLKLIQKAPLSTELSTNAIYLKGVQDKWTNYLCDLSKVPNTGNPFNQLIIIPDINNTPSTTYINKVFFTNNSIVSVSPSKPLAESTSNSVDLKWTAVSDATAYCIIDGATGGVLKHKIAELNTTIEGLNPNTSYSFCLVAVCENVESLPSPAVTIKTLK